MPIYEYQCSSCGAAMEKLQRVNAEPLKECPKCHRDTLLRVVSTAGFRLSGGGWYETDFKTSGKRNLAGDSDSSAAG